MAVCKLSVIICTYNEERSIIASLRSLYNNKIYLQTEVILIDDCSTNSYTLRLLTLLERYTRFKIIRSEKNMGLSNSRNLGFSNATTAYVLPLDADDTFPPNMLDIVHQAFIENPDVDFIAGDYFIKKVEENAIELVSCYDIASNKLIDIKKLAINWKLLGTSPCKKNTWEKVSGYDLKYSYSVQDVDFWIRVLKADCKGLYLNKPIYIWNKSSAGMNTNFDRIEIINLMNDHPEFYLLNCTKKHLYNTIFQGYYPYKQKQKLIHFGKIHFSHLTAINRARLIRLFVQNLFE